MLMGSLLLSGCGIKDIAKNATEEIIGEENVYEKALDIHKNPAKYAKGITGNVLQEKETEREHRNGKIIYTSGEGDNAEIYLMNSNGTNKENLTKNKYWDAYPQWSPDGEKILFYSERDHIHDLGWDIFIMDSNGSGEKQLTNIIPDKLFANWSYESDRIILSNGDIEEGFYSIDLDGSNKKPYTSLDIEKIKKIYGWEGNINLLESIDKKRLLVVEDHSGRYENPQVIDMITKEKISIPEPDYQKYSSYNEFSLSLDGKKVLFSTRSDNTYNLYSFNTESARLDKIKSFENQIGHISWSPNGEKILFVMENEYNGKTDIYLINSNGAGLKNLTNTEFISEYLPSWQSISE